MTTRWAGVAVAHRTLTDLGAENVRSYPMTTGGALRSAIAEHQRRFYGLEVDPDRAWAPTDRVVAAPLLGRRRQRVSSGEGDPHRPPRRPDSKSRCLKSRG